jgi:hypothetical protein
MPSSQVPPPEWAAGVASTIIEQLGGSHALQQMLGHAIRFSVDYEAGRGAGLRVSDIDLSEAGGKVTAFRVLLAPSDTYDVEFFEGRAEALRLIDSVDDIYDDMLVECIERRTGYALTLPFADHSRACQSGLGA